MRAALFALLFTLAACSGPGTLSEPPPLGSWRGTLVSLRAGSGGLPAQLFIEDGGARVTLIAGASRSVGTEARSVGTRLVFRVDQFPVTTTTRRPLRCDLANVGGGTWQGDCRAGTETYSLRLLRSTRG